ncbi:MAG: Hsp70 family protein [Candidatus Coatesbacteria bacterium]|nr:Hsp70 family protein [Candidatus Coatesbacteria bacterium]
MGFIVGIDLGTTNSAVAIIDNGSPRVIPNRTGSPITPSVVGVMEEGGKTRLLVGEEAKRQLLLRPDQTVAEVKRVMGTDYRATMLGREYTPQEISAVILKNLKEEVELFLDEPVTDAVITVPAYFQDVQRQATKDAGEIAGLNVRRIINEPTAAALAFDVDRRSDQVLLVYDLGGGTFDVSIIEVNPGIMEVIATTGDSHLGGTDFDRRIMDWVLKWFEDEHGIDLRKDPVAMQQLKDASERAKIELSSHAKAVISIPAIAKKDDTVINLSKDITRSTLEGLIQDLLERTMDFTNQALEDAELTPQEISQVLLVGGSTKIPLVRTMVRARMKQEPCTDINPDECVALGAAVQAGLITGQVKELVLSDILSHSLGTETIGDTFDVLISRHSFIPTSVSQDYTTVVENQSRVRINVLEGESKTASENVRLGTFILDEIPPGPPGSQTIRVKFDIDNDGILTVTATDLETGKANQIIIEASKTRLSDEDIVRAKDNLEELSAAPGGARTGLPDTYREAMALITRAEGMEFRVTDVEVKRLRELTHELEMAISLNDADTVLGKSDELSELLFDLEDAYGRPSDDADAKSSDEDE